MEGNCGTMTYCPAEKILLILHIEKLGRYVEEKSYVTCAWFVTTVDSLYECYLGHCPLLEVYLIYTTFGKWLYYHFQLIVCHYFDYVIILLKLPIIFELSSCMLIDTASG
jgi:hypothetical protein